MIMGWWALQRQRNGDCIVLKVGNKVGREVQTMKTYFTHKLSRRQCNVVMSLLCLNKYVEIKERGYGILLDGAALCRLFIVLQSEDNINFKDNKKVVDFDFSHILVQ